MPAGLNQGHTTSIMPWRGVCLQLAKCRTPNRRDPARHVLYVDDYRDMREQVAEALPDAGFKAFVAEAGSWMC